MTPRYARVFLVVAGLVFVATGLTFLCAPDLVPAIRDAATPTADARNDARAIYGAMEAAIGTFLLACARDERLHRGGLLLALHVGALAAVSRFAGYALVAGTPVAHLAYGALDAAGAVLAAYGLLRRD